MRLQLLVAAIAFATGIRAAADVPSREHWEGLARNDHRKLCYVEPAGDNTTDDALAIARALNEDCYSHAVVVLPGDEYHMNSNITTMGLQDVQIHLYGTLLWSTDLDYWLSVSMPIGFQNQSTVWYFGGDRVSWDGHGTGTLNGNGQIWYDWAHGRGNLAHRPIMINWKELTNSVVRRQRFVQAQMWTMATSDSKNVLFEDIYVNNTSSNGNSTLNTDGIDTITSDHITLRRWDVTCGDDGIALKRNSSNIFVYDSVLRGGQGIAIGSLAQYLGVYDYVENFYARNMTLHGTNYAIYYKTWAGNQNGYPPNGGGGGLGHAQNVVVEDIVLDKVRSNPFWAWQCENYSGASGQDCDSSTFSFQDLAFRNVSGTMLAGDTVAAKFRFSAAGGAKNVTVDNFSVTATGNDTVLSIYYCANLEDYSGFECQDFPAGVEGTITNIGKKDL